MNNIYIKHYAEEDSLTHYGVKGMKWRKHKAREEWSKEQMYDDTFDPFGDDRDYSIKTMRKNLKKAGWPKERIDEAAARRVKLNESGWKQGFREYYKRKEGSFKARRSITKTLSGFGKTSMSKAKKTISKGKSFF